MSEATYIPVRIKGKLLFKYDPIRQLIQIKAKKELLLIDLEAVAAEAAVEAGPEIQVNGPMTTTEALETIRRIASK